MRLFEAIMEANHRALAGDAEAGVHPGDFEAELPVAALTCIDARLNTFFPGVLGLPKEHFIWLRNAGNIITGPMSSTMRSLALACAIKGAKEIAVIGHTDCLVCKTSASKLTEAFRALGVERGGLPDNLTEFFGLFASERQNVIKAVDYVRQSPLIGPKVPVHGRMVDIATGKLDWAVNGYQVLEITLLPRSESLGRPDESPDLAKASVLFQQDALKHFAPFQMGEMKFPETKIGEIASGVKASSPPAAPAPAPAPAPAKPAPPAPLHYPPPVPPRITISPRYRGR
jgi:carbonic anhydrase